MSILQFLPFVSTAIMLGFTIYVLERFFVRRQLHFLFWGLGLAMFGIGSFAEAYLAFGWSKLVFICWYLFGAILNPSWLGMGTLYLLVRKRWVHFAAGLLVLASIASTVLMLSIPINGDQFKLGTPISMQYKSLMSPASFQLILIPTIIFGIVGLVLLVGGALYSAFLFWRKRVLPNRVIGNVLIAVGALSVASASELTHLGYGQYLYIGELLAAVLMFVGFRFAARPQPEEQRQMAPAPAD